MGNILGTYSGMLIESLGQTMLLTLLSLIFAFIIGLIFGLMNVSKSKVLNLIGTIYVDAIRGVPLLVLAYFIYFGVPAGIRASISPQEKCYHVRCKYAKNPPCRS